jgi:hypothetical protein
LRTQVLRNIESTAPRAETAKTEDFVEAGYG